MKSEQRLLDNLAASLHAQAQSDVEAGYPVVGLSALESAIEREGVRFTMCCLTGRGDLAQPRRNLIRLAERMGYKIARGADDSVTCRRMDRPELRAQMEKLLRQISQEAANELRTMIQQ